MSFRKSRYHLSHRICRTILLSLARSSSTVTSLLHLIKNIGSLSLIHAKPPFQMDAKRQTKLSQFDRDTYTRSNVSLSVTTQLLFLTNVSHRYDPSPFIPSFLVFFPPKSKMDLCARGQRDSPADFNRIVATTARTFAILRKYNIPGK